MAAKGPIATAQIRYAELQQALSQCQEDATLVGHTKKYINELEVGIREQQKNLNEIQRKETAARFKEEERVSTTRKLRYKMAGKSEKYEAEALIIKEEHEAAKSYKAEAATKLAKLQKDLEAAKQTFGQQQSAAKRHEELSEEVDSLFIPIFAGPMPEFPEEDEMKEALGRSESAYNEILMKLNNERQIAKNLAETRSILQGAQENLKSARNYATMDAAGVLRKPMCIMKYNAVQDAQQKVGKAKRILDDTTHIKGTSHYLGDLDFGIGHSMAFNFFFDNIFTDLSARDDITDGLRKVTTALTQLGAKLEQVYRDVKLAEQELSEAAERVLESRRELRGIRAKLISQMSD